MDKFLRYSNNFFFFSNSTLHTEGGRQDPRPDMPLHRVIAPCHDWVLVLKVHPRPLPWAMLPVIGGWV